ncbi:hypothetical protein CROQUDRAFT_666104 [Cronartium quercuum f. sp. fusiforme G11]|uniref:EamA domain-containing protein n=1 Tax=Cronartium quercuum f. sp. fusiforme G11 TaxID=708437 RepID=A0A9P6N6H0_9BASI|nr:hypothetical protein CROQUDRAFT_666104 [Cronartium quercuum f. sp. fusiforme G11]
MNSRITFELERSGPFLIFPLVLIAYTVQSELSQVIQRTYPKPYLLLYLTHSAYLILLPFHLLTLKLSTDRRCRPGSIRKLLNDLKATFVAQYELERLRCLSRRPSPSTPTSTPQLDLVAHPTSFPLRRFALRSIQLTLLIALPSLSWYASVSLTDLTSITAIYNTNAFFAYLFALAFLRSERLELKKLIAVLAALLGVLIITFADSTTSNPFAAPSHSGTQRLLGTGLAFAGSLSYAAYEVWYKKVVSLPDPQLVREQLGLGPSVVGSSRSDPPQGGDAANDLHPEEIVGLLASAELPEPVEAEVESEFPARLLNVPSELYLLHANLITTTIGFFTLTLLWIPIPILHWCHWERFALPPDSFVGLLIVGMVSMGVIFNAGFMVLLGLWGPVVASVGNLCTLVLVAIADAVFVPTSHLTLPVGLGCLLITAAFSILMGDMMKSL